MSMLLSILFLIFTTSEPPRAEMLLSNNNLRQGDTLVVEVLGDRPDEIVVGGSPVPFVRMGDRWVSFVGFDHKSAPGSKEVQVSHVGGSESGKGVRKIINLSARDFGTSYYTLPKTLTDQGVTQSDVSVSIASKDKPKLDQVLGVVAAEAYFNEDFVEPLARWKDVGAFGVLRQSEGSSIRHLGVDLDGKKRDPVMASNMGRVVLAEYLPSFGNTVVIDHGLGIFSLYLHLDEIKATLSHTVDRGEVIGTLGNTGAYSLEPHLHFSTKIRGRSVDPRIFIDTVNSHLLP